MRCRWLTLVVMVYIALDLANPMMPGAVQLVGPSLETVAGYQPRGDDASSPVVPLIPHHVLPFEPLRKLPPRAAIRATPRFPLLVAFFRAPFEPSSTASSSPDDD